MIFEVHQYKCRYLGAPAQIKLYDEIGRAAHERHCGKPIVFGVGETGEVGLLHPHHVLRGQRGPGRVAAKPCWRTPSGRRT